MKRMKECVGGEVFDLAAATARIEEGTRWDGGNPISLATGQQFNHEALYRTAKGTWVLESSCEWQGSGPPKYAVISHTDAVRWLVRNERIVDHDDAIEAVHAALDVMEA